MTLVQWPRLVLLLHKLLLKVLPVTTFYVCNSVISLYILCLYLVHISVVVVLHFSLLLFNCVCLLV